jgi:hypothetical protein
MSGRPLAGSFRLLCDIGAAIGVTPGLPLPLAPSGTRAAILKKCGVVYSKTKEDRQEDVRLVLDILRKERFYACFAKCEFAKPEVN